VRSADGIFVAKIARVRALTLESGSIGGFDSGFFLSFGCFFVDKQVWAECDSGWPKGAIPFALSVSAVVSVGIIHFIVSVAGKSPHATTCGDLSGR
jgi:hypothetical protein